MTFHNGDAAYGYDALGRMTSRTRSGTQQLFRHSGLGNDIAAITDPGGTIQARYARDPFGGLLGLQEGGTGAVGAMSDLHHDLVATHTATALADTVAYDPFGQVIARTGSQRGLGYQGEYTDPDTGNINMHSRWYQPGTGGFASRDTATLDPDPSIQVNRYTYANAAPLTGIDPTGHAVWDGTSAVTWPGYPGVGAGHIPCDHYCQNAPSRPVEVTQMSRLEWNGYGKLTPVVMEIISPDPLKFARFSEAEAKKQGVLPNGYPMPKHMKFDFWAVSDEVREDFLIAYHFYGMASLDWSEQAISRYWYATTADAARVTGAAGGRPPEEGCDRNCQQLKNYQACVKKFGAKECREPLAFDLFGDLILPPSSAEYAKWLQNAKTHFCVKAKMRCKGWDTYEGQQLLHLYICAHKRTWCGDRWAEIAYPEIKEMSVVGGVARVAARLLAARKLAQGVPRYTVY